MSAETVALIQNAMSAGGLLILSVPAFSLNNRKKSLARIVNLVRNRKQRGDTSALNAIAEELELERKAQVGQWYRIDEICLFAGYFLLLGAAIWRLFN